MVAIQENHTETVRNKIEKTKKSKKGLRRTNKSKLKRKKNKKSKKGLTNVNIKKPAELINAAEANLNKSLEEKDPQLVLEEGARFFNKLTFDTTDENAVTIGKYSVSTKNADKRDVKFIEDNLDKLTIMALYDAVTFQGKLFINAISESVLPEQHDLIVGTNEKEARSKLELGENFNILREQKELVKEMIFAVLKNIFEENEGTSKKGFLGRNWDKLVGNAATPMKAFINFIDKNPLISELNKLPEEEGADLKYYACLTALQLNDKNSFFNDIPASKFFAKMVGAMSYLPLDPKKVDNDMGKQTVKINSYDKKNCKDLLKWLFKIAGASLPKFQIVPKTEFCLDSTFSPRILSLVGGGLAIAGAVGAIGYRGYIDPENKETGFFNKLGTGLKNQGKKDFQSAKDFGIKAYNNTKNWGTDKYKNSKDWGTDKYNKIRGYFTKKGDNAAKVDTKAKEEELNDAKKIDEEIKTLDETIKTLKEEKEQLKEEKENPFL